MKDIDYEICAMSKAQLAQDYLPGISLHSATNRLGQWIAACPPLVDALQETGYRKTQRMFTARQVELIIEHLGEP